MKREREAKSMVKWMLKVVFEENLVSQIGRACLIELGCKSRWWSRCRHITSDNHTILVERSELEWDGEIRDESELGILEEAHL